MCVANISNACMPSTMTRSIHPHPAHTRPLVPTYRSTATSPWHLCRAARTNTRSSECSRACSVTCGSAAWQVGNVRVAWHTSHSSSSLDARTHRTLHGCNLASGTQSRSVYQRANDTLSRQSLCIPRRNVQSHRPLQQNISRLSAATKTSQSPPQRGPGHHQEKETQHTPRCAQTPPTATSLHSRCFIAQPLFWCSTKASVVLSRSTLDP
jgi:hypothetical protein